MPAPARTSRQEIVNAARRILEADGLDALTMQRVAADVGVKAPSLYKRVRSRGELIRSVVEDTAAELSEQLDGVIGSGDPRLDLQSLANAVRRFAHASPASYALLFAPLPQSLRPATPVLEQASAAVVRTAAALAGETRALDAARTIVAWAHGFISMELSGAFRLGGDVDSAFDFGVERLGVALARHDQPIPGIG